MCYKPVRKILTKYINIRSTDVMVKCVINPDNFSVRIFDLNFNVDEVKQSSDV